MLQQAEVNDSLIETNDVHKTPLSSPWLQNLWLEVEAPRLCRFNYKSRFDRVKIEIEGFKSNQMKESSASSSEKDSGTSILPQQVHFNYPVTGFCLTRLLTCLMRLALVFDFAMLSSQRKLESLRKNFG